MNLPNIVIYKLNIVKKNGLDLQLDFDLFSLGKETKIQRVSINSQWWPKFSSPQNVHPSSKNLLYL